MIENPVVRKQTYDLRVPSRQSASEVYLRIERAHRASVVPVLAGVMREIGGADELVLIDRVELDLGSLRADDLEEQLAERIAGQLRRRLAIDVAAAGPDGAIRALGRERADVEALEVFLVTGVLPWWAPAGGALHERLERALEQAPEQLAAMLRRHADDQAARRLARQFPVTLVRRVIVVLAGSERGAIDDLVRDWLACVGALAASPPHAGDESRAAEVHAAVARTLCEGAGDVAALSRRVVAGLERLEGGAVAALERRLADAARTALTPASEVRRWIDQALTAAPGAVPASPSAPEGSAPSAAGQSPSSRCDAAAAAAPFAATAGTEATPARPASMMTSATEARAKTVPARTAGGEVGTPEPASSPPAGGAEHRGSASPQAPPPAAARPVVPAAPFHVVDEEVGLPVDNAGLVLLWPFLPRFFAEVGLLEDGVFAHDAARERAALLLHHVATGEGEVPEPSLVVNKLLCGLDLAAPAPASLTPSRRELGEIDELHDSVLQAWSALGATSAAGLRVSFLQREGVLSRQELGWNLEVARLGYDVLLDRLPWGIGLVMLPWMQEPLVVQW